MKLNVQEESNQKNEKYKKELEDLEKAEKCIKKKRKLLKSCLEWEIKYGKKLESEIVVLEKKKEKLLNEEELLDKVWCVQFVISNNWTTLIKYTICVQKLNWNKIMFFHY